jgi:murein DD-endopeptidase MepM/ murein hydrolase activator NlpD
VKLYTGGVRHDYKGESDSSTVVRGKRWLLFLLGLTLPLLAVGIFYLGQPKESVPAPSASTAFAGPILERPAELVLVETAPPPPPVDSLAKPVELLVKAGDTLEILFRRNGLSLNDLAQLVAMPEAASSLKLLKPGDRLGVTHRDGKVMSLERELDDVRMLNIAREQDAFVATTIEREVDIRTSTAHGAISSSLFEAGIAAGMTDKLTMDMAGIFEWDIDFIQDVREGDEFTVIYEELWRDGVKIRNGAIVAAEFVNQGKSFRAARYKDATGHSDYYTPEGRSLRKAFIRAPLNFTRISSNFNPNRKHPVLNTIRAHRGVDYAAPTGTPIRAAGDGKVLFRGVQGGYGNVIILQHGGNITTLYGHMSKFGNARVGARVRQGEVIGYVGKSGLATGPHLHYEYRVNGAHRNPRTVPLPPANPVPAEYQDDFRTVTATLWRELDLYEPNPTTVAAD